MSDGVSKDLPPIEISMEPIQLSDEDMDRVLDAINNPPEPNEALKEAVRKTREAGF